MRALFHFRNSLIAAVLLSAGTLLQAQNLTVYDDALENGFQDWSWNSTRNFSNTSPVHSGSHSISVSITLPSGALRFQQPSGIDPSSYSQLSFWITGSFNMAQLQVMAVSGNNPINTNGYQLFPPPAGTWTNIVIPLTALGVTSTSVLNGFWIQQAFGSASGPFYVDDVSFIATPPPSTVHVTLDATNVLRKADSRWLGLNTAAWDSSLDSTSTVTALTALGTQVLRWPGGSWGDIYHGMNEAVLEGQTTNRNWGSFTTNFIHVATNIQAKVFMIANYGSSTPQEAADWLRFCNITNNAGFKYWEIGNEIYGSWEEDLNTTSPYQAHDPWTYAMRFRDYYVLLKAADPTVKVGAVVVTGEDSDINNHNHVAINAVTGQAHYGWTPVVLATLKLLNITPDFLIDHYYPEYGQDSDATLLQAAKNWASDAADLRGQLTGYLGDAGTNVEIICTENNADSGSQGRQSTSLVNGLYLADSLSQVMKTEINGFIWWDLRNGIDTGGDFNSSLYGWRSWGDLGIMYGDSVVYPTYYSMKLMQNIVLPADSVLNAPSDYKLLASYAVRRTDGGLSLLVINKHPTTTLSGNITLANFTPASTATILSYGIPQDNAAKTGIGSPDIATNTFSVPGTNFTYGFAPYSMTLFEFPKLVPPAPQLKPLPSAQQTPGYFAFQLQGQALASYIVLSSTDLTTWTPVSTNTLAGSSLWITNPAPSGAGKQFWRVLLQQ